MPKVVLHHSDNQKDNDNDTSLHKTQEATLHRTKAKQREKTTENLQKPHIKTKTKQQ